MDDKIEAWLDKALSFCDKADCVGLLAHLRTTPDGYRLVPVTVDKRLFDIARNKAIAVISARDNMAGTLNGCYEDAAYELLTQYLLAASQESGT